MPPAIFAENVTLAYGPDQGIFDLTTQIDSGICAVVGHNGAGKSTFFETLQGLRTPQSGTVQVLGHDPVRDRGHRAQLASLMGSSLQSATPYPTAKPDELMNYVAGLYPNPADPRVLLDTFDVPRSSTIKSLSGGEVQRLKCALALIGNPVVVILDEPTAGLDPSARLNLYQVLNEYATNGATMLISTHLTEDLDAMANRAIVLNHGRIVSDISASELKSTELLRFTTRVGLPIDQLRTALSGEYLVSAQTNGVYIIESDHPIPASVLATVASWCAENNATTSDLTISKNTLASTVMSHFSEPSSGAM